MAKKKQSGIMYSEPADYFPKEVRKEFGLGEYYDEYTKKTNKAKKSKTAGKSKKK